MALQKCISAICLLIGWVTIVGFWLAIVYGHYYFGYANELNEASWSCYAKQDKDVLVPWDVRT